MLYSLNPLLIAIIPAFIFQYIAAIFCLLKLLKLDPPKKKFAAWNFFILLIVYIGFITFLICYYFFKNKVFCDSAFLKEQVNEKERAEKDSADTETETSVTETDVK